jgi:chromosome segregation ATPase
MKCPMCRGSSTGFRIYSIDGNVVNAVDAKFVDVKDLCKIRQNIDVLEFTKSLFEDDVITEDNKTETNKIVKMKKVNADIIEYQQKKIEENVLHLSRIEMEIKNAEEQNENRSQLNLRLKQEHNILHSKNILLRFENKNLKEQIKKLKENKLTAHEEVNETIESFNTMMDTITSLKRKIIDYKKDYENLKRKKIHIKTVYDKIETVIINDDDDDDEDSC